MRVGCRHAAIATITTISKRGLTTGEPFVTFLGYVAVNGLAG
jgi:hypothetical protein